jgi:hypothetical protein
VLLLSWTDWFILQEERVRKYKILLLETGMNTAQMNEGNTQTHNLNTANPRILRDYFVPRNHRVTRKRVK